MKKLRWQLLIVVVALGAISLLLLGQQPVLQPNEPPKPAAGGIYTEALIGSYGRLNPLLDFYNSADRDVSRLIFSGLIKFDSYGLPQGDLAESWGINEDGTTYNFALRSNAVWQDGKPVTSDDVLFTVGLMQSDDVPLPQDLRDFWKQIKVNRQDDKTVQFVLPEPFAPFLDYLSFGILPKHLLADVAPKDLVDSPFNLKPVGSGPYQFDRLITSDGQITGVILSAFKDYYNDRPFIDQIVFQYYPDAQSALAAYDEGNVLGISHVTADVLPKVLQEPNLKLYTGRMPHLTLIYLNLDNPALPFFQDASVRRALLMGLNRQWMVDRLMKSQAIVADGPIYPDTWAYYDGIEHLDYDPQAALSLLKQNDYTIPASGGSVRANKDNVSLSFEMVYPDGPTYKALADEIQSNWARLGVEVKLKAVSYEQLVSDYLEPRTYQAALVDLNLARSPDPDPYPFWDQAQATGGQNYAKWDDRQASEYLERARITVDLAERTKAYRNFQVRFTSEMPALPLFYPVYSYAVDAQVQGVRIGSFFDPSDRFNTITSWYLLAGRSTAAPAGTAAPTP